MIPSEKETRAWDGVRSSVGLQTLVFVWIIKIIFQVMADFRQTNVYIIHITLICTKG